MVIVNTGYIRTVSSKGPKDCKIAIVGEAPGSSEMKLGEPFVGSSGKLLNNLLSTVGIVRSRCFITNVIKEQPYRNNVKLFIDLSKKVVKETPEYHNYVKILKKELDSCKANVIVAVGAVPLYALCNERGIVKKRGSIYESTLLPGRKVIPTIHPAAALRQYTYQHYILYDLIKVKKESEFSDIILDENNLIVRPSFIESINYLEVCNSKDLVAFDIEVSNHEVSCISFSYSDKEVISIPFIEKGRDYFPPDQEAEVWKGIATVLENRNVTKLAQNASFDITFLFRKYGIRTRPIEDTMVAQAIIIPDFPKGLDFITSIYTNEPYYKDEGKFRIKTGAGSDEKFWKYNAKDSIVLMKAFPKMFKELMALGNVEIYRHQTSIIEPLVFMGELGIRVDHEGLKEASKKTGQDINELNIELEMLTEGSITNPNSVKQVKEYFYEEKKEKPYISRSTHNPTVNEDALKRLSRKGYKEADILLRIRTLSKLKGTYLDVNLDEDRRLRCAFNPVGTKSGRLSSSKTIFGTGTNLQNQPREMKKYMLADKHYIIYNVDLGQAENRVVAYISPEHAMIEAFERGIDIHSQTAGLIFRKPIDEVSDEDNSCPIGGGRYSERFWGKKANHGLNYDLGYKSFALYYEIPEQESKFIVSAYHTAYPGIRQYYEWIQSKLREDRTLINPFGRKRKFMGRWGHDLFKEAYSWVPQSTVADKINRDGVLYIYQNQQWFKHVELLNQVHDSIVFQIPISAGIDSHAEMLIRIKKSLESPITWRTQTFSIPMDIEMGVDLKNTYEIDVKKVNSKEEMKNAIESSFMEISSGTKT
jgi:uracil-DNA glycosylase family 4